MRSGNDYVFTAGGAVTITAVAPCASPLPAVASCPVTGISSIRALLGDMGDSASYDDSIVDKLVLKR